MLQSLYSLAAAGSFCWFLASSLVIFPHSLSFFNEAIGGPLNGPEHLLGSAVDWGQDLRYLTKFQDKSAEYRICLAYLGSFDTCDIESLLSISNTFWKVFEEDPTDSEVYLFRDCEFQSPIEFIISVNFLMGDVRNGKDCKETTFHIPSELIAKIGKSQSRTRYMSYAMLAYDLESSIQKDVRF